MLRMRENLGGQALTEVCVSTYAMGSEAMIHQDRGSCDRDARKLDESRVVSVLVLGYINE